MTKAELIYVMSNYGIELPSSGTTEYFKLHNQILDISFSDATKTKMTDKNYEYKFDMNNKVIIQRRISPMTGKVICYPGTDKECVNVFGIEAVYNFSSRKRGAE